MGKKQRILDEVKKRGTIETQEEANILNERMLLLKAAMAGEMRTLEETVKVLVAIPAVQEQLEKMKQQK